MAGEVSKPKPLRFDWDESNKYKNWERHRVDFRECEEIFFNKPLKIFYDYKHSQKEDRFTAFGITNKGRKLTVIFTIRKNKIRIISARGQSRKEKKNYEEN